MKKALFYSVIILALLAGFFYILCENPSRTKKLKVLDCETTYQDYYFNNWSLRNWVIKPQPTTEFSRQFAKKEVGQCLYEKYFISLDPRYRTELLKLFKDNHEIKISVKNFEINTEFKEKTGRNTPSNPVYFDPNYLE